MMNADRVYNKAGAPCTDCKRITFELHRVCPWCAKARREKQEADVAAELEKMKLSPVYQHKASHCWDNGGKMNDVRSKQRRIEVEGMNTNLADG